MKIPIIQLFFCVFLIINNTNAQWTSIGLSGKPVSSIISIGDIIIVGTQYEGIYRTTNGGNIWSQVGDNDLHLASVEAINVSGNILIAGTNIAGRGTYNSIDSGASWTPVYSIIDGYARAMIIRHDTVLLGTSNDGVYRSTDQGNTWVNVCPSYNTPINVRSILWNENTIYVGTHTNFGGVWKSTNLGDTWVKANSGLPQHSDNFYKDIYSLISYNNFIFAGIDYSGCYRTSDGGTHWDSVNTGLSQNSSVYSFASDESAIYLGTNKVYQSIDNGNNWSSITNNLPTENPIMALYIHNGFLYAVVYGSGIWKLALPPTDVQENLGVVTLDRFILDQNYPNPFNPSTTFSFNLPKTSYATLKVFDLLGKELAILVNRQLSAGKHEYHWNATDLPSGIYFYRLQAGQYTETKKLILLR